MQALNNNICNFYCLAEVQETLQWYMIADQNNGFTLSIPKFNENQAHKDALSYLHLPDELNQAVEDIFNKIREYSDSFTDIIKGEDLSEIQDAINKDDTVIQQAAPGFPSLNTQLSNKELLAYWLLMQQGYPPINSFLKSCKKIVNKIDKKIELERGKINIKIKESLTSASVTDIEALLKRCSDINADIEPNKPLLYFACEQSLTDIITLLIKYGAKANSKCIGLAINQGEIPLLKELLKHSNEQFKKLDTIAFLKHYAPASLGESLPLLLEKLPNVSPYYVREVIIDNDEPKALDRFIQQGRSFNHMFSDALRSESALCIEKILQNKKRLEKEIDFTNEDILKAIDIIAEHYEQPLQQYFRLPCINVTDLDDQGYNFFHEVVMRCSVQQLDAFIKATKPDVNIRASSGYLPIQLTINAEKIKLIIDAGADLNLKSNFDELIIDSVDESLVALYLQNGAKPTPNLITRAIDYKTCYLDAILDADIEVNSIPYFQENLYKTELFNDILARVISKGFSFNKVNKQGKLLSHVLCTLYPASIVKLAINAKAIDVKKVDKSGFTSLIQASINGNIEVVELLAKEGVDVNHKTRLKFSALTFAIYRNDEAMVRCLIKLGACTTDKVNGKSLLSLCQILNFKKLIPLLT